MKYIVSFILLIGVGINFISAQTTLTGHVTDENNLPLPFATIRLLKDSVLIQGQYSDTTGYFMFPNLEVGQYQLTATYTGSPATSHFIALSNDTTINININTAIQLNEVVVTGNRPMIKREVDRLVFNVGSSPASSGMNVTDLLKLTPLVKINDNSIGIVGKSSAKIMMNGKILYLDGSDLIQYLKSLHSDDISSIEVITTPPARYDAEGSGGLINIVSKKKSNIGWDGSIGASYIQRSFAGVNSNLLINYQSNKLYFSAKLRQNMDEGRINENYNIYQQYKEQESISLRNDKYTNWGGNFTLEYQINPSSSIGMAYDISHGNDNMKIDNSYKYYSNNQLDSLLSTQSLQSGKTMTHIANLYYDLKIDSLGKKLSIIGNFMNHTPDKDVNFITTNEQTQKMYVVREPNNLVYHIYTGEANLELPFSFVEMETGLKYSDISNKSDMQYYNQIDNVFVKDVKRCNQFDYTERIIAGSLLSGIV